MAQVSPKTIGMKLLCAVFEWQVARLRNKHEFVVVAVAGSLGKTSTKLALAQLLEHAGKKVRYQTGNYNVRLTVPLVIFGHELPGIFNVFAWIRIFVSNERQIKASYPFEVVVVELGTDAPGQIEEFAYLQPELGIVTAIALEHMENFKDMEAVVEEEFSLASYAKQLLLNGDDVAEAYRPTVTYSTYGIDESNDYMIKHERLTEKGQYIHIEHDDDRHTMEADIAFMGKQGMKIIAGVAAAADMLGISTKAINLALLELKPFAGRMQRLHGIQDSIIIDDTYNASPDSVLAALEVAESIPVTQRIAILGSMNELGDYTEEAHHIIGKALYPQSFDLVVTIGEDAERYIAPLAQENGCTVVSFLSPYDAGDYVQNRVQSGALIIAKGSQNRVFAEEALKPLLKNPEDVVKLVRQSSQWIQKKQQQFLVAA